MSPAVDMRYNNCFFSKFRQKEVYHFIRRPGEIFLILWLLYCMKQHFLFTFCERKIHCKQKQNKQLQAGIEVYLFWRPLLRETKMYVLTKREGGVTLTSCRLWEACSPLCKPPQSWENPNLCWECTSSFCKPGRGGGADRIWLIVPWHGKLYWEMAINSGFQLFLDNWCLLCKLTLLN